MPMNKSLTSKTLLQHTPKVLYFALSVLFFSLHQFRSPFITTKYGINKHEVLVAFSVVQLCSFFFNMWIAALNDQYGRQKLLITTLIIASLLFFQTFFYIKSKIAFWLMFCMYFCCISPTLPLLDKFVLDYLRNHSASFEKSYPLQRMWCTAGYIFTNFFVDHIVDSTQNQEDFSNLQWYNAAVGIVACILMYLFISNSPRQQRKHNYSNSILKLFRNTDFMYFIFIILLCGITRASMTQYLSLYYKDVVNMKKSEDLPFSVFWPLSTILQVFYNHQQTMTTVFGVIPEIVIFFIVPLIFKTIGLFWPLLIAILMQLLRFLAYYTVNPKSKHIFIYCCLIELLKGIGHGLTQSSATLLVSRLSPPDLRTTSQILYNGAFIALGTVFSGAISGIAFSSLFRSRKLSEYEEFKRIFEINIIISVCIVCLFLVKYVFWENLLTSRENVENKLKTLEDKYAAESGIVAPMREKAKV